MEKRKFFYLLENSAGWSTEITRDLALKFLRSKRARFIGRDAVLNARTYSIGCRYMRESPASELNGYGWYYVTVGISLEF